MPATLDREVNEALDGLEAASWHAQKATDEIDDKQRAAEARRVLRDHFVLTRRKVEDAIKL